MHLQGASAADLVALLIIQPLQLRWLQLLRVLRSQQASLRVNQE